MLSRPSRRGARYGDRVEVLVMDIYDLKPKKGDYWDCAWFDIWDDLCTDNLEGMAKLGHRFTKKYCGYAGYWGRELLRYRHRQERNEWWYGR